MVGAPLVGGGGGEEGLCLSFFRWEGDWVLVLVGDDELVMADAAELELKVDNLERELMAGGPGG